MVTEKPTSKKDGIIDKFVDAAAEVIKSEGYLALTVRKVADRTEYSYPAMYHYFEDLDHLFALAKARLIRQTVDDLLTRLQREKIEMDDLYGVFKIYTLYYFEHPNLFRFFNHKSIPRKYQTILDENAPDFDSLWQSSFAKQVELGRLKIEDVEILAKTIIYAIHGMINLALSNNGDLSEETIVDQLVAILDYLLE